MLRSMRLPEQSTEQTASFRRPGRGCSELLRRTALGLTSLSIRKSKDIKPSFPKGNCRWPEIDLSQLHANQAMSKWDIPRTESLIVSQKSTSGRKVSIK